MSIQLNKEQNAAVIHTGSPLLVAAGPGSGKTTVIVERIKHLLKNGLKPSEILCLTFTERAAAVMKERLEKVDDISEMQISTYHSFCHDVLRNNVLDSGIGIGSGVITRASLLVWGLENFDSFGFEYVEHGNSPVEVIEAMIDGISVFKDELVTPEELRKYLDKKLKQEKTLVEDVEYQEFLHKLEDLHRLFVKHQEYLRKEQLIDYDDMIVETINLFQRKSNILKMYQNQFKYVLVDEFQDNNYAQMMLVLLLTPGGNITVVGDDDQSIMKFQGAYAKIFDDFMGSYKDVKVIKLVQNYRSPKDIVEFSSDLLKGKLNRIEKDLYSLKDGHKVNIVRCSNDSAQVEYVITKIQEIIATTTNLKRPITFSDFTILSRSRNSGRKFAQGLNSHGIPATFVGDANLFSTSIGRDAMAYLEIASDSANAGKAITRVLQNMGISEQNIARINHEAGQRAWGKTYSDFVFEVLEDLKVEDLDQVDRTKEVSGLLHRCIALKHKPVLESVYEILMRESGLYKNIVRTDSLENKKKQTILKKILQIAEEFNTQKKNGTLVEFIEYVRSLGKFDVELEEGTELTDAVRVSTIHQSKGNEFPFVFVVDVASRSLPTDYDKKLFYVPDDLAKGVKNTNDGKTRHIEEERRILYVAMTRAIEQLFITYPTTSPSGRTRNPSKFLVEDLDYENNSHVEIIDFDGSSKVMLQERNKYDVMIEKTQAQILGLLNSMQLKSAIEKIIDLAKIKQYLDTGSTSGFDIEKILKIENNNEIELQLRDEKIPQVCKESLKLSATAFDLYLKCPMQFKFDQILNVPTKPSTMMSLGTIVHRVFQLVAEKIKKGDKVNEKEAFDILEKNWSSTSYNIKQKEDEDKQSAKEMIREYLNWIKINPNEIVEVEKKFNMKIADVKVTGKIDLVMKTPKGEYQVFDFKTGNTSKSKKQATEDTQMNLYPLAVKDLYGKLPEKSSLYYIAKNLIIDNEIISKNVMDVKSKLERVVESILKEEFAPEHEKGACRNCNFKSICDYAESN